MAIDKKKFKEFQQAFRGGARRKKKPKPPPKKRK
jgi:hypothetical protein